jgi:hypothetical protein
MDLVTVYENYSTIYFSFYLQGILWAVFVIFYYKVTACKIIRMYEVYVANLSKVCQYCFVLLISVL